MRFVDKESQKPVKTDIPCLKNLADTLQGFRLLWKKLKILGFDSFCTRNINQDPLENFFGCVKSHDFRSNKPTCSQFESIFKSILITSLSSKHSPGYNCEEDSGDFILNSKSLLSGDVPEEDGEEQSKHDDEREKLHDPSICQTETIPEKGHLYIDTPNLIKSIQTKFPEIKSCSDCSASFQKDAVKRPNCTYFKGMHFDAKRVLGKIITLKLSIKQLARKAKRWLKAKVNFAFYTCVKHKEKVFELFSQLCIINFLFSTLTYVNRILKGKIVPRNKNLCPPIKEALATYLKTLRKEKRDEILKPNRIKVVPKKCTKSVDKSVAEPA